MLAGQDPPMDAGIEKTKNTKPDLINALAESFAYCDRQYAEMTDAAGAPIVKFDAGGEIGQVGQVGLVGQVGPVNLVSRHRLSLAT